ncbi:MAG: class F sortase [Chloroflexi bacterium]|nr:class F sortase [Chloroflexota bacterium]
MRAMRQAWCLAMLIMALILSGCGGTPPTISAEQGTHGEGLRVLPTPQSGTPIANPARLLIPAIKVDAFIESVGIMSNGDMATPTQSPWENVGWYNAGPLPGQRGSAVIDGHLDRPGGAPAVFWRLREARVGDEVMVVDSAGKTLHFHVARIAFYAPEEAPVQEIFGDDVGVHLNLITCAGDWVPSERQTTLRLVVFTSPG